MWVKKVKRKKIKEGEQVCLRGKKYVGKRLIEGVVFLSDSEPC